MFFFLRADDVIKFSKDRLYFLTIELKRHYKYLLHDVIENDDVIMTSLAKTMT